MAELRTVQLDTTGGRLATPAHLSGDASVTVGARALFRRARESGHPRRPALYLPHLGARFRRGDEEEESDIIRLVRAVDGLVAVIGGAPAAAPRAQRKLLPVTDAFGV